VPDAVTEPPRAPGTLTAEQASLPAGHPFRRLPWLLAALGVAGLGATFALDGTAVRGQLHHSYLVALLFWLTACLGALGFVLVQFAARAGWSVVIRRPAEALMAVLPLFALLFLPLAVGLGVLWPQVSDAAATSPDAALRHQAPWLAPSFFLARAFGYLGLLSALAVYAYRVSVAQDRSADPELTRRLQRLSGPGLVLLAVVTTGIALDWILGLDPHWVSTIFGLYIIVGAVIAGLATLTLAGLALERAGVLRGRFTALHLHDLGKLLLGLTLLWAFLAGAQALVAWYGNLPEETIFYARRWYQVPAHPTTLEVWPETTWRYASIALALGHAVIPALVLLPRAVKRSRLALGAVAVWLLAAHLLDLHWLVLPNLHRGGLAPSVLDLTAWLGVGGVVLAAFTALIVREPVVPVGDPRLPESLDHVNP